MAANDPRKPRQSGRVRLPPVDSAMNKVPSPNLRESSAGGKEPLAMQPGDPGRGQSKQLRDQELLARARKRFLSCVSAESDNRKQAVDDLKFKSGEGQWPMDVVADRNFDMRPCLTINKLPTFVNQVVNAQRENRPAININPVGDKSDPEVAKMYRGLIRAIERDCQADIAYDTGFESEVSIGWGYWRVMLDYESPETLRQTIVIRRVRNTFTVYMDPRGQEPDGSDARFGFVTEMIPRKDFEADWPNADPMAWTEGGFGEEYKEWVTKDEIRIAEYYEVATEKRRVVLLANGHEGFWDELDDAAKQMEVVDERWADVPRVMHYKLTAVDVLEEAEWPGKWIPIVKAVGTEIDVQGKVRLQGLIRNAKSPQMMYNFHRLVALNTPIATPDGWVSIGDIHEGAAVFDESGAVVSVLGESPTYINLPCFRVTFDDGSFIDTDGTHEWRVEERGKRKAATWEWTDKTLSTSQLMPGRHFIWVTKPLSLPEVDLPVHPYVLGLWLGDGTTLNGQITPGDEDVESVRANVAALGYSVSEARGQEHKTKTFTVYGLIARLREAGVLGNKHIPQVYLRASQEQRWALLQGLMDTDGSQNASAGVAVFVTTLPALRDGICELLRTLGIKPKVRKRAAARMRMPGGYESECLDAYYVWFSWYPDEPVFRLDRHLSRKPTRTEQRRRTKRFGIKSVTAIPSVPVKCIAVDSPSHLFLAGRSMIPTHNTLSVELTSLQPKAPWIMEEGQVEGHEQEWKQANTKTLPYLLYKGTDIGGRPAPPPQRQPFSGAPAAVLAEVEAAAQDMMAVTGIRFDATRGERVYDESGRALKELRERGDLATFHYIDNFARSLRFTGEILVDLIPKVYEQRRMLTILREDDSEEQVQIDPQASQPFHEARHPQTGKTLKIFNPNYGKYGVTVTIGPSYATKRIEAGESMMDFARALGPQVALNIGDLVAKNMDWPGADEVAARLAKMLPPELLTGSTMKDVPPQVQAMLMQMQKALQAAGVEKQQLLAALTERQSDRALQADQIEKNFEAKLMQIVAQVETKMAAVQQKQDEAMMKHVGGPIAELARGVEELRAAMERPLPNGKDMEVVANG